MPLPEETIARAIHENTEVLKKISGFLEKMATPELVEIPLEDTENLAKLVGVTGGFAQLLTGILDDPNLDTFKKANELRSLAQRASNMSEEFSNELKMKDQARAGKSDNPENGIR